jgi:hypothetical protein
MGTPRQLRVTRVVLGVNAFLAGTVALGMFFGLAPRAAEHPYWARHTADRELAGALILAFLAKRLPRDPGWIVLAMVFVGCNLAESIFELALSHNASEAAPLVPEAIFFTTYTIFFARWRGAAPA